MKSTFEGGVAGLESRVLGAATPASLAAPISIPLLPERGMIMFSGLLALGAILILRRQRQQGSLHPIPARFRAGIFSSIGQYFVA